MTRSTTPPLVADDGIRVSRAGIEAACTRLATTLAHRHWVCYPAQLDGRRVVVLGWIVGPSKFAPVAILTDDALAQALDITEAQTVDNLIIDDRRAN